MPNPLFTESSLPYGMPPFDRLRDGHFLPAFEKGMEQQLAEVETIVGNPEPASFENTLVALERSGATLDRVSRVFFNLVAVTTNPALQEIEKKIAPRLATHRDVVFLDPRLFARIRAVYEARAKRSALDAESLRLIERYYRDFVRAGALLGESDKKRLREINAKLAELSTVFSQNVLNEVNDSAIWVDKVDELDGLTPAQIKAAADAAKAHAKDGKYLLALQNTTIQPVLASLSNRALRERIYRASVARGSRGNGYDNRSVLQQLVALRAERAKLLGYDSHAAYVLDDQMARTPDAVGDLLNRLAPMAAHNAAREAEDIRALIGKRGDGSTVQPWDWAFFAEQVRHERYRIDEASLKPYFELNNVLNKGVFFAAARLYGLRFEERPALPVYHPDVRVWEVFDADGKGIGIFIGDFYARESKKGGAWMNQYVLQSSLRGARPVVGNHLNILKPPAGEPTLLTYDEVRTMFHEFGHALHGLLSAVKYPRFGGTTVPRDFVEFPSQLNEIWSMWPEVLANYARHYRTGKAIPSELVKKLRAAEKFNQGYMTTEYIAAAILDLAWHRLPPGAVIGDVAEFERRELAKARIDLPYVPPRYLSPYFSHVFAGGYSAGYYAYVWAEVLDADAERWFIDHGGLARKNGDRLRRLVLSRGGSAEAMDLYRAFAGRDPSIEPLLERRGLKSR